MSQADVFRDADILDNDDVDAAYSRWAPVYDLTFEAVMKAGRVASAAIASKVDGPILDVGVGTGLELPMFAPHTKVFGVDLCEPMLRRAAQRVRRGRLSHVGGLAKMDGARMAFPDDHFACVVAPYLLSVVPEPVSLLNELARVMRPGGDLILVNHMTDKDDPLAILEKFLDRHVAPHLGWRPQFPWTIIGDWIDARPDMRLIERRPLPPFGLFTLIHLERLALETTDAETAETVAFA